VIVGLTVMASPAWAETPEDLIGKYEWALKPYLHIQMRVDVRVTYDGFAMPPGTVVGEGVFRVWRDGLRWKCLHSCQVKSPHLGKVLTGYDAGERLLLGRGMIDLQMRDDGRTIDGVSADFRELPEMEHTTSGANHFGTVLYGTNGGFPTPRIPDLLRRSQMSVGNEVFDGKQCWLLRGTGQWGEQALWLDPTASYLPRRILLHRQDDDLVPDGRKLSTISGNGFTTPKAKERESTRRVDQVRIERVSGKDVITGFVMTDEMKFEGTCLAPARRRFGGGVQPTP
jgi:hypothetical protein